MKAEIGVLNPSSRTADGAENAASSQIPSIRKAKCVHGRSLRFRGASVADAEFVHALRTDSVLSRFLSTTAPDLEAQKSWLERYCYSNDEVYFIIEAADRPIGTVRLYDGRGDSFCWGSWILVPNAPPTAAIESALIVYAFAVDHLKFKRAHFDVRKGNEKVWRFHERLGAERTHDTEEDFYYQMTPLSIQQARARYVKYLPDDIVVD